MATSESRRSSRPGACRTIAFAPAGPRRRRRAHLRNATHRAVAADCSLLRMRYCVIGMVALLAIVLGMDRRFDGRALGARGQTIAPRLSSRQPPRVLAWHCDHASWRVARVLAVETNRPVEAVVAAELKPDGGRSRLLSRRSRASTDAAVHRHAVPRTDVTVLDQRLPLRLAKRSPRRRELGRCRLVAASSGTAAARSSRARARDGLICRSQAPGSDKNDTQTVASAMLGERRCCVPNHRATTTHLVLVLGGSETGDEASRTQGTVLSAIGPGASRRRIIGRHVLGLRLVC